MRLFVGLGLDANATAQLERLTAGWQRADDGLRWSRPQAWHVTLEFLGHVSDEQYACLVEALRGIRAAPFEFTISGTGSFERAGIFYAGVEPTPALLALERAVVEASASCGFGVEPRAYHPHITLARRRSRGAGAAAMHRLAAHGIAAIAQHAGEFLLYESLLLPTGAEYTVRKRFPLAAT